jgi:antitoxin (DNA-binding transcriptional repressor) of toxin-antitoxin stability system
MRLMSLTELHRRAASLRKDLAVGRQIVLTSNGRPFAILSAIDPDKLEDELLIIRCARALVALSSMRAKAKADGLDRMTNDEIEDIIRSARRERRTHN